MLATCHNGRRRFTRIPEVKFNAIYLSRCLYVWEMFTRLPGNNPVCIIPDKSSKLGIIFVLPWETGFPGDFCNWSNRRRMGRCLYEVLYVQVATREQWEPPSLRSRSVVSLIAAALTGPHTSNINTELGSEPEKTSEVGTMRRIEVYRPSCVAVCAPLCLLWCLWVISKQKSSGSQSFR